jgi:hypothetical protein
MMLTCGGRVTAQAAATLALANWEALSPAYSLTNALLACISKYIKTLRPTSVAKPMIS